MTVSKTTEGEIGWLADGEKAEQTILNRPLKQFLAKYNVAIDQINADIIASSGTITNTVPINKGGTGAVTAADARTSLGTNNATNLTTGTMPAARMPDIDAAKTTTGVFNIARIPTIPTSKISPAVATQTDLTTAVNELTLEITRSPLPTFTGNAEFNGLNNVLKMSGLKDAMELEVGDVLQFSNTVKNNKIHTVESFITTDTELDGNISGPNQAWKGFVSFTGKADDAIGFGYGKKLVKLVDSVWTELPLSTARNWTGVTKLANGRVFAATQLNGSGHIYEIFADGTDSAVTTTSRDWRTITSVDNTLYVSLYNNYVYKLDILNTSSAIRDQIGPALTTAYRNFYGGIIVDGDYLYHTGDTGGVYRKNLKDATPCVRVDIPNVNQWRSNFITYNGNIYCLGDFGSTEILDRTTNTFIPTDKLFDYMEKHYSGFGRIEDGTLMLGMGLAQDNVVIGTNVYIRAPVKAGDIILNYHHSATRGNGSLKLSNETKTGVNIKLLSKWYHAPIGLGQAWQDVTSSRAIGVTYTNTTGRPIYIQISTSTDTGTLNLLVNGVKVLEIIEGAYSNQSFGAIVPAGNTYQVPFGSYMTVWSELR